jgi:hypothetical protein
MGKNNVTSDGRNPINKGWHHLGATRIQTRSQPPITAAEALKNDIISDGINPRRFNDEYPWQ